MKTNVIMNTRASLPSEACVTGCAPALPQDTEAASGRRETTWVDLIDHFPSPQECLAAFIVSCAAGVLAGVKPATLIRILNRQLPCGRCMFQLWQEHGTAVLARSPLRTVDLRLDADGVLILFYRPELLARRLSGRTMRSLLQRRGYPEVLTVKTALDHLQRAFQSGASADEVGLFLGYPAKDVNGFIARKTQPWGGRCLWRIYGPPRRSLQLYRSFCAEREMVTGRLLAGESPEQMLKAS